MKRRLITSRKRIITLILGLLMIVSSALGPWSFESTAEGESVTNMAALPQVSNLGESVIFSGIGINISNVVFTFRNEQGVEITSDVINELSVGFTTVLRPESPGVYTLTALSGYSLDEGRGSVKFDTESDQYRLSFTVRGNEPEITEPEPKDPYVDSFNIVAESGDINHLQNGNVLRAMAIVKNSDSVTHLVANFSNGNEVIPILLRKDSTNKERYIGTYTISQGDAGGTYYHASISVNAGGILNPDVIYEDFTVYDKDFTITGAQGHVHTYDYTYWRYNATSHWRQATCGHTGVYGDLQNHAWGEWVITTEATTTTPGSRWHQCTVCDYISSSVIPIKGTGTTDPDGGGGTTPGSGPNPNPNPTPNPDNTGGGGTDSIDDTKKKYPGRYTHIYDLAEVSLPERIYIRIPVSGEQIEKFGRTGISAYYYNKGGSDELIGNNLSVTDDSYVGFYIYRGGDIILVGSIVGSGDGGDGNGGDGTGGGGGGSQPYDPYTMLDPYAPTGGGNGGGNGGQTGTNGSGNAGVSGGNSGGTIINRVVTTYTTSTSGNKTNSTNKTASGSPKTGDPFNNIILLAMMIIGFMMVIVALFVTPEEEPVFVRKR